jgi:hypothetical protein
LTCTGNNDKKAENQETTEERKSLEMTELGNVYIDLAFADIEEELTGPARIRTLDQWIMSPLLYR